MRSVMREPQTAALLLAVLLLGAREPAAVRPTGPPAGEEITTGGTVVLVPCFKCPGDVAGVSASHKENVGALAAARSVRQVAGGNAPAALLLCVPRAAGSEVASPPVATDRPAPGRRAE